MLCSSLVTVWKLQYVGVATTNLSTQQLRYVQQQEIRWVVRVSDLKDPTVDCSDMTRKSVELIKCIISGEDEDEDPQHQHQQQQQEGQAMKLKSVKQVYDMIT